MNNSGANEDNYLAPDDRVTNEFAPVDNMVTRLNM